MLKMDDPAVAGYIKELCFSAHVAGKTLPEQINYLTGRKEIELKENIDVLKVGGCIDASVEEAVTADTNNVYRSAEGILRRECLKMVFGGTIEKIEDTPIN